jgi:hypothetical protein
MSTKKEKTEKKTTWGLYFGWKTIFIPLAPSENEIFPLTQKCFSTSFVTFLLKFLPILRLFYSFLPIFSFYFAFLPFNFLPPFSYFFPQMTSADTGPYPRQDGGGGGYLSKNKEDP